MAAALKDPETGKVSYLFDAPDAPGWDNDRVLVLK
jgi:hypothetical protein